MPAPPLKLFLSLTLNSRELVTGKHVVNNGGLPGSFLRVTSRKGLVAYTFLFLAS